MSPAVLERNHGIRPDYGRIVAISAAISLNAAVLLVAMRPLSPRIQFAPVSHALTVRVIEPDPVVTPDPPPPIDTPKPPRHKQTVHTRSTPAPTPHIEPTPVSIAQPEVVPPHTPVIDSAPSTPTPQPANPGPVHADLAYIDAPPPRYPTIARRSNMQGTVMLRVRVDTQGRPLEVKVARSSGYTVLDRAARLQVLRKWRFQPAQVNGRPAQAWAMVPVVFSLTAY